ncbi:MAG: hypothetical protein GF364_06440 [Candidatus Lokiarchaeota archaeon]|nr:hypothetical protein [Candidatus Lokiarchaeota archaeon]
MILELDYNLWEKLPGWIAVIIESVIISFYMYFKIRSKKELESTKKVVDGYIAFILGFALCRLLFIFSDFERDLNDISQLYTQLVLIGYIVNIAAFVWLAHIMEFYLLRSKTKFTTKLFAILLSVVIVMLFLTLIYYNEDLIISIARYTLYGVSGIAGFVVFLFYVKLIKDTVGVIRKKFIIMFVGLCFLFGGMIIDAEILQRFYPIWLPSILSGIGILVFALSQKSTE